MGERFAFADAREAEQMQRNADNDRSMARARPARWVAALMGAVLIAAGGEVRAAPFNFSALLGNLQASVTFDTSGTDLIVTLRNISLSDVLIPAEILTAVFWDVNGAGLSLTPGSAVVPAGSSVLFGTTDPGSVVGGEWAYNGALDAGNEPFREYGISSSGLGLFGPGDRFPGTNLEGPDSPDGLQYGITSAGDNPATGNQAVTGGNALIKNVVVFTLPGLPVGFDPSTQIRNVLFQYGTSLDEPHFPEPTTLVLLGAGALVALRRRRA